MIRYENSDGGVYAYDDMGPINKLPNNQLNEIVGYYEELIDFINANDNKVPVKAYTSDGYYAESAIEGKDYFFNGSAIVYGTYYTKEKDKFHNVDEEELDKYKKKLGNAKKEIIKKKLVNSIKEKIIPESKGRTR